MGLTLHYELRLPENKSADDVDRILLAMHVHARTLPIEKLLPLTSVQPSAHWPDANGSYIEFFAELIAEPYEEEIPPRAGDVRSARGFVAFLGEGSESATFGFLERSDEAGSEREWYWRAFCKTQYASNVSDAHFIQCHRSLVSMLDHAITLGVDVSVTDETDYWETRDEGALLDSLRRMNRIMAAFAGKLEEALGPDRKLEAPIFEHPRFERLEMGED